MEIEVRDGEHDGEHAVFTVRADGDTIATLVISDGGYGPVLVIYAPDGRFEKGMNIEQLVNHTGYYAPKEEGQ
jgi:hypothetical protein